MTPLKTYSGPSKPDWEDIRNPFPCLSKEQKQKIVLCDMENKQCHDDLQETRDAKDTGFFYTVFLMIGAFSAGAITGLAFK